MSRRDLLPGVLGLDGNEEWMEQILPDGSRYTGMMKKVKLNGKE